MLHNIIRKMTENPDSRQEEDREKEPPGEVLPVVWNTRYCKLWRVVVHGWTDVDRSLWTSATFL